MTKGKILVLGAGKYQRSGLRALKKRGYYVIALDANEKAEGRYDADEFQVLNILSFKAVDEFIKSNSHTDIISCLSFCTDAPILVVGEINSRYKLKGLKRELTEIAKNKFVQRQIMKEAGLPTPGYQVISSQEDQLDLEPPFMVKPVDSAGSRGVRMVRNREEVEAAILGALTYSTNGQCIVEEFIPGVEYTLESLISTSEIHTLGISEKTKSVGNYTVAADIQYNSPRVHQHRKEILRVAEAFFKEAGFNNSVVHTELIRDQRDGTFYLIESSLRGGGFSIFDKALPYLASADVVDLTVSAYLEEPLSLSPSTDRSVIMRFLSGNKGSLRSVSEKPEIYSGFEGATEEHGLYIEVGDEVADLDRDGARVGYIFTYSEDWHKAFELANLVEYSIQLEID